MEISGERVDTIITFDAGPGAPNVIQVPVTINDDQVGLEAVEMFSVSLALTQPSDAVMVATPNVTVVNIIDDDGRCTQHYLKPSCMFFFLSYKKSLSQLLDYM